MDPADSPPKIVFPEMGADGDMNQPRRPSILPKACENCRVRKIRCNKIVPCSNCQISNLTCTPPLRRTEHRVRRTPSATSNPPPAASGHDIEALHERLSRLELALQQLLKLSTSPKSSPAPTSFRGDDVTVSPASVAAFQGDSSFDRHTLQAGLSAELTAQDLIDKGADMELAAALASLKTVLNSRGTPSKVDSLRFAPGPPVDGYLDSGHLPPAAYTAALLKKMKADTPLMLVQMVFKEYEQLEALCRKAYFPCEPLPAIALTLLNGVLMYLIEDQVERSCGSPEELEENKMYAKLCEKNFYLGLQQYDTLTNPTLQNVQVLLLGAVRAQESSRPSLHITLLSAAARLCHVLGYHRKAALRNMSQIEADACREAFWTIYGMEQNWVLSFGRPSSFHEDDIDQDPVQPTTDPELRGWDLVMIGWTEFARIQGRIYRKLYSVKGLKKSLEKRQESIEELSKDLTTWYREFMAINTSGAFQREALDYTIKTNDFVYYASLTLLYRAEAQSSPQSTNGVKTTTTTTGHSHRCVEAARLALESHIQYFEDSRGSVYLRTYYIYWVLLWPACTPLVVVFNNAITTRNSVDLRLLEQVQATLDQIRTQSEVAERLYSVCAAFVRFATAYFASSQQKLYTLESRRLDFSAMEEMQLPGVQEADMIEMDAFLSSCWGEDMQPLNGLLGMDVGDMRF